MNRIYVLLNSSKVYLRAMDTIEMYISGNLDTLLNAFHRSSYSSLTSAKPTLKASLNNFAFVRFLNFSNYD